MSDSLSGQFIQIGQQIGTRVLGQTEMVEKLLFATLADSHVLLEGPPGVAKTRSALLLAHALHGSFARIQFTPDLLPADLTGSNIYDPGALRFEFRQGPLFHDLILADEINRAPAKVQAALLEAMAERQVTVGGKTHRLDESFFVIATQNPIEEEGTYELPVAQLDRFAIRIKVNYPDTQAEVSMLDLVFDERSKQVNRQPAFEGLNQISRDNLLAARRQVLDVEMSEAVKNYVVRLVAATRRQDIGESLLSTRQGAGAAVVAHPVSPRGTLALAHLARARAWLADRTYVTPEDVQYLCQDALAHRLVLTHQALIGGVTAEHVINAALESVPAA